MPRGRPRKTESEKRVDAFIRFIHEVKKLSPMIQSPNGIELPPRTSTRNLESDNDSSPGPESSPNFDGGLCPVGQRGNVKTIDFNTRTIAVTSSSSNPTGDAIVRTAIRHFDHMMSQKGTCFVYAKRAASWLSLSLHAFHFQIGSRKGQTVGEQGCHNPSSVIIEPASVAIPPDTIPSTAKKTLIPFSGPSDEEYILSLRTEVHEFKFSDGKTTSIPKDYFAEPLFPDIDLNAVALTLEPMPEQWSILGGIENDELSLVRYQHLSHVCEALEKILLYVTHRINEAPKPIPFKPPSVTPVGSGHAHSWSTHGKTRVNHLHQEPPARLTEWLKQTE